MFKLCTISLVVMGLSYTISRERIFAPLRDRLGGVRTWWGYFVSCPYCVSYWVAFLIVPLTDTYVVEVPHEWGFISSVLRWFLSSVLVTVIAAFFRIGFYFVDESQGLIHRRQRAVERNLDDDDHQASR